MPAAHAHQLTTVSVLPPSSIPPLVFSVSPSISDLSNMSQDTATHTKTPWAVLFTLAFLPATARTQLSHSPGKRLTEYSAFSNHVYSSCSFHLGGFTNFARFTPYSLQCWYSYSHSTHLCTEGLHLPPELPSGHRMLLFLYPSGNCSFAQYFTSLLHWTSNYRRLWESTEWGPSSLPMRQFISHSFWHGSICMAPSPKLTSLPSQLGTAALKGDATEPEDHNHFTLTLERGEFHCKAAFQPF